MADELVLSNMKEALADKVRAMVLDMLPKETIEQAIEQEFKRITEGVPAQRRAGYHDTPPKPPLLKQWIAEVMEPMMQEHVKTSFEAWLHDPCNNERVGAWVERAVKAAARTHFEVQVASIAEGVLRGWEMQNQAICSNCGSVSKKNQSCQSCGVWVG